MDKLDSKKIEAINDMLWDDPKVVACRVGVNKSTVYAYMKLLGREFNYCRGDFGKYVELLRKMENHPGIIEHIETDMEFNLPKKVVLKNAMNELGLTWREAEHVYDCVIPKRQRSRSQRALVKRKLSNAWVPLKKDS